MNIIKRYLEKRKQEEERRKQEEFLNTKIPLNDLFFCYMFHCCNVKYMEGPISWDPVREIELEYSAIKILRKLEKDFIDPTTGTRYKRQSASNNKIGDIVVSETRIINFKKEVLERQYITMKELIALNEELNNNK